MPDAAIDACCLIDLLASEESEAILRASGFSWNLPTSVRDEVQFYRRHDPNQPGQTITVPVDLSGLIASNVLTVCAPRTEAELDHFTRYAMLFRSDGEAMCLALAGERMWTVATDDRRAIRIARQAGLAVVSCPELIKAWATATGADRPALHKVLRDIEVLLGSSPIHPCLNVSGGSTSFPSQVPRSTAPDDRRRHFYRSKLARKSACGLCRQPQSSRSASREGTGRAAIASLRPTRGVDREG